MSDEESRSSAALADVENDFQGFYCILFQNSTKKAI